MQDWMQDEYKRYVRQKWPPVDSLPHYQNRQVSWAWTDSAALNRFCTYTSITVELQANKTCRRNRTRKCCQSMFVFSVLFVFSSLSSSSAVFLDVPASSAWGWADRDAGPVSGNIPPHHTHTHSSVKHTDTSHSGSVMHWQKKEGEERNKKSNAVEDVWNWTFSEEGGRVVIVEWSTAPTKFKHLLQLYRISSSWPVFFFFYLGRPNSKMMFPNVDFISSANMWLLSAHISIIHPCGCSMMTTAAF